MLGCYDGQLNKQPVAWLAGLVLEEGMMTPEETTEAKRRTEAIINNLREQTISGKSNVMWDEEKLKALRVKRNALIDKGKLRPGRFKEPK